MIADNGFDGASILNDRHESNYQDLIFNEFAANAAMSRQDLFRKMMDPRRDIDDECGYPKTPTMDVSLFREMYDRESIATRVVQVLPLETWQTQPSVFEAQDSEIQTPFELAWDQLAKDLRVESWYQDEEGSPIWEHLLRADILSGIGHFGIILLGINDGKPLSEPIDGFDGDAGYQGTDEQYGKMGLGADQQYGKPGFSTINAEGQELLEGFSKLNMDLAHKHWDKLPRWMTANYAPPPKKKPVDVSDDEDMKDETQSPAQAPTSEQQAMRPATPAQDVSTDDEEDPYVQAPADDEVSEDGDPHALTDPQSEEEGFQDPEDVDPNAIDQAELDPNAQPEVATKYKLQFIRAFDESLVSITRYDANPASPRYGQPTMYLLTLNDPSEQHSGIGLPLATLNVHWSRVIHIADNLGSSEVFGVPRQRPVWNRLYDLRKLYGGSAEMYWRGAFPGLAFETHPQLGGEVSIDKTAMRQQVERYMNTLQRYITAEGMTVKSISPTVVDPSTQIDTQITAICIVLGVPQRIFMGSERGELASGQDDSTWTDRVEERQVNYVTPRIIIPFVDRLIKIGVLPEPSGYSVEWPGLKQVGPAEQANIANTRTTAMATYLSGGVDTLMAPLDFLTRELGMDESEAEAVLESTLAHMQMANPDANPDEMVPGHAPPEPQMMIDPETGEPMEVDPNDPSAMGEDPEGGDQEPSDFGEEEEPTDDEEDAGPPAFAKKKPAFAQNGSVENYYEGQPRAPEGTSGGGQFIETGAASSYSSRRRAQLKAMGYSPKARVSLRALKQALDPNYKPSKSKAKPTQNPDTGQFSSQSGSNAGTSKLPKTLTFKDRQKLAFRTISRYHVEQAADEMVDAAVDRLTEGKKILPPKGERWKALKSRIKKYTVSALKAAGRATKDYAKQEAYAAVERGVRKGVDAVFRTERGHKARMKYLRKKKDLGAKAEAFKKDLHKEIFVNPGIRKERTKAATKMYTKYPHLDPLNRYTHKKALETKMSSKREQRKRMAYNELTMNEYEDIQTLNSKSRIIILSDLVMNGLLDYVYNFNPNHDDLGRFAEGSGGGAGKSIPANKAKTAARIAGLLGEHTNQFTDAHLEAFDDDISHTLARTDDRQEQIKEIMAIAHHYGITKRETEAFRARVNDALDDYATATKSTAGEVAAGYGLGLAGTAASTAAGALAGQQGGSRLGGLLGAKGKALGGLAGAAVGGIMGSSVGAGAAHSYAQAHLGQGAADAASYGAMTSDVLGGAAAVQAGGRLLKGKLTKSNPISVKVKPVDAATEAAEKVMGIPKQVPKKTMPVEDDLNPDLKKLFDAAKMKKTPKKRKPKE